MNPIDWKQQLNEWRGDFERGWRTGSVPRIEEFLARAAPDTRPELLLELLALELACRRARGETPTLSEYLVRFPGEARVVAQAFSTDRNENVRGEIVHSRGNGRATNGHPELPLEAPFVPGSREAKPTTARPPGRLSPPASDSRPTARVLLAALLIALAVLGAVEFLRNRKLAEGNRELARANEELTRKTDEALQSRQEAEWQTELAARRREDAERNEQIARDERTRAELKEQQAADHLYASEISLAAAALQTGQVEVRSELLNHWTPRPGEPDRRGFEWWYLNRPNGMAARPVLAVAAGISRLCESSNHETIAAIGQDAVVRVLNPREGMVQKEIATGQGSVHGGAFSPAGATLATAGEDGTIRLWDLATPRELWQAKPFSGRALQVAFTPEGGSLLACGDAPHIHRFDAQSGRPLGLLEGQGGNVNTIALSRDGKLLASAGEDEVLHLWDLSSNTRVAESPLRHAAECLLLDGEHDLIFIGSAGSRIETFRIDRTEGKIQGLSAIAWVGSLERVRSLALAPGGRWLAAGGVSGAISVWPTENGNLGPSARQSWIAHRGSVQSLLWSPDGGQLISAGGDGQITTWTLESAVQDEPRQFRTDFQHRFCLIPGTPLMVGVHAPPRTLILWDWKHGRHTSVGGYLPFDDAAPAPDGRFFAIIRRRHEVLTYEVPPNGEFQDNVHPVGIWQPGIWIEQVKVAPDSQTVAAVFRQNEIAQPADSAGVMLLKTPGLEVARTISFPGARRVAFAPSGNRLAISNGTTLALFDARGAVWSQPQAATDVLEFSPDGALIASVGSDQAVWIRSAATGQLVQSLTGNGGPIRTVAFSPDGKTLATGGYDGAIILWHVPGLRELFKLRGPGGSCVQLAFSSDSRHLVSLIHTDPTIFGVIQTFNAPEDDRAP